MITRFVIPDDNDENDKQGTVTSTDEFLSIPLHFKATIDIKIFGERSTINLSTPVAMSGKFDAEDGLLTAVDVSFDCVNLLSTMIAQARTVVKTASTKAAGLSVQIAEWDAQRKKASLTNTTMASMLSLQSLFSGSMSDTMSLRSLSSLEATISSIFNSFPSLSAAKKLAKQKSSAGLSASSRGLLRNFPRNSSTMQQLAKSNATFDFGPSSANSSGNKVKFQMPSNSPPPLKALNNNSATSSLAGATPQASPEQEAEQQDNGNIHEGLFSWLKNDNMFLSDEKIQEQNAADVERERKQREAPMPMRFFTAAEDMGGGERGLEIVSNSIFGASRKSRGDGRQDKKRHQDQSKQHTQKKRRKLW